MPCLHDSRSSSGVPPLAGLLALLVAAVIGGLVWLNSALSAHNNITCKQHDGSQYELCVSGQSHPVIVPYSIWQSARVGGYYDTGTGKVYVHAGDDPAAPHGFTGGEHGGFGGAEHGGFGGAHGGGGR